jgi:hypothetical protein
MSQQERLMHAIGMAKLAPNRHPFPLAKRGQQLAYAGQSAGALPAEGCVFPASGGQEVKPSFSQVPYIYFIINTLQRMTNCRFFPSS